MAAGRDDTYTRALLGLNGCTYEMAYRNLILHVRYDHNRAAGQCKINARWYITALSKSH